MKTTMIVLNIQRGKSDCTVCTVFKIIDIFVCESMTPKCVSYPATALEKSICQHSLFQLKTPFQVSYTCTLL